MVSQPGSGPTRPKSPCYNNNENNTVSITLTSWPTMARNAETVTFLPILWKRSISLYIHCMLLVNIKRSNIQWIIFVLWCTITKCTAEHITSPRNWSAQNSNNYISKPGYTDFTLCIAESQQYYTKYKTKNTEQQINTIKLYDVKEATF